MVLDLVLIGTGITLGPLHNSAFILLLSSERGVRKGLAFILAWLASLVLVIAGVLVLTGGTPPGRNSAPSAAAEAVKLSIGVALVVYGELRRRRPRGTRRQPKWMTRVDSISVWTAAGLAFLLQPWGLVGAGAATVVQADLSDAATVALLFGYCVLASASLLVMELYTAFSPEAAGAALGRMRQWVDSHQEQAIVLICLLVGLWLTGNSIDQLVN
ncbi:GAP family protein [Streptomyces sp. CB03911]|uniref:GAP family protein n=1 Tax=Streptomycetaceae TaxID=2062 RepID=UPI000940403E|nr:GAP family protein [Streptomyces sp. CB03911]OKI12852.1 hypothetical protein A6A07_16355 [Streptomyces sp. CB03911]